MGTIDARLPLVLHRTPWMTLEKSGTRLLPSLLLPWDRCGEVEPFCFSSSAVPSCGCSLYAWSNAGSGITVAHVYTSATCMHTNSTHALLCVWLNLLLFAYATATPLLPMHLGSTACILMYE